MILSREESRPGDDQPPTSPSYLLLKRSLFLLPCPTGTRQLPPGTEGCMRHTGKASPNLTIRERSTSCSTAKGQIQLEAPLPPRSCCCDLYCSAPNAAAVLKPAQCYWAPSSTPSSPSALEPQAQKDTDPLQRVQQKP